MKNTADVTGGKPIAILPQSISGVSAINPLVAFSCGVLWCPGQEKEKNSTSSLSPMDVVLYSFYQEIFP
jgi:hypothetical protein